LRPVVPFCHSVGSISQPFAVIIVGPQDPIPINNSIISFSSGWDILSYHQTYLVYGLPIEHRRLIRFS
jgi:hypothetical protein